MADPIVIQPDQQSILMDHFFYFFLRLRKGQIRKDVEAINARYPQESVEQRARRLIVAQTPLSFLGGVLMSLPVLVPGLGQALKILGVAGGASVVTRMHLYLIMEIALLFGKDIDDQARVPEMVAVVLASGLGAGTPFFVQALGMNPLWALPVGGLTYASVAKLIGESAIRYYSGDRADAMAPVTV
jgi:hypothetical protein